jgi:membrane-bound lytic murein transglycosylase D
MLKIKYIQMKKLLLLSYLCFVVMPLLAQTTYRVPNSLDFAGVTVRLDETARTTIQNDVNTLVASRKVLDSKLEKMAMYFPIIESILVEEDIPNDFKYICVQESSLIADAISSSNAVGFWQFKKDTGADFGLKVDGSIDERKNIHASTRAACMYLKKNNTILNNWLSSLWSYRVGLGGVNGVVPRDWAYSSEVKVTGSTDWYVLRALAHKFVLEQELLRFVGNVPFQLLDYKYGGGKSFEQIAQELEVEETLLRQYNLWADTNRQLPDDKEYVVTIPVAAERVNTVREKVATASGRTDFIKNDIGFPILKRITPAVKDANTPILYEINDKPGILAQEGDTPISLAMKVDMKPEKFMAYNDLSEQDRIVAGEVYYLKKKNRKAVIPYHTVRDGETLWKISQTYAIRLSRLLTLNRLEQIVKLQPGRVVWLMKKRPKNKPIEYMAIPEDVPQPIKKQPKSTKPEKIKPIEVKNETGKANTGENKDTGTGETSGNLTNETTTGSGRVITTVEENGKTATQKIIHPSEQTGNSTTIPTTTPDTTPSTDSEGYQNATSANPTNGNNNGGSNNNSINQGAINKERPQNVMMKAVYHTVAAGQTYYSIARQYNLSVQDIFRWNNLDATNPTPLKTAQRLKLYRSFDAPMPAKENTTTTTEPTVKVVPKYHTVAQGETVYSISKKYGTTPETIRALNNLKDNSISVGQKIKVLQ